MSNSIQNCIAGSPRRRTRYQIEPQLIEEAFELPEKIIEAKDALTEAAREYDEAKAGQQEEEALFMALIQAQVTPAGKPQYSNADQRAAALSEMKKASAEWLVKAQETAERQDNLQSIRTGLEFLQDRLSLIRRAMSLAAAELEFLTCGQTIDVIEDAPAGQAAGQLY